MDFEDFHNRVKGVEADIIQKIQEFDTDLGQIEVKYKERLESAVKEGKTLEHEAVMALKDLIEANTRQVKNDMELNIKKLEEDFHSRERKKVFIFQSQKKNFLST